MHFFYLFPSYVGYLPRRCMAVEWLGLSLRRIGRWIFGYDVLLGLKLRKGSSCSYGINFYKNSNSPPSCTAVRNVIDMNFTIAVKRKYSMKIVNIITIYRIIIMAIFGNEREITGLFIQGDLNWWEGYPICPFISSKNNLSFFQLKTEFFQLEFFQYWILLYNTYQIKSFILAVFL